MLSNRNEFNRNYWPFEHYEQYEKNKKQNKTEQKCLKTFIFSISLDVTNKSA